MCVMEPKEKTLHILRTNAFYSLGYKIVVEALGQRKCQSTEGITNVRSSCSNKSSVQ